MFVVAPTIDGSVRQERTRRPPRADRDRVGEAAHDDRCRRVGRGAVPQLAVGVVAPALGGPVRQQRTRMVTPPMIAIALVSRSPPPVSTHWSWCRCPTDRRRCCPNIWRCRWPTTHTHLEVPRKSRSRWSGRSPPPASTSRSWCRCRVARRRCQPQHLAVPPANNAHEWLAPALIATAVVRPLTTTGVDEPVVVPFPNWPAVLSPQHLAVPFANNAHEWSSRPARRRDRDGVSQPAHRDRDREVIVVPFPTGRYVAAPALRPPVCQHRTRVVGARGRSRTSGAQVHRDR